MRLLIGYDGRDGGRDALELARVLAGSDAGASALVVTVLYGGVLPRERAQLPPEEAGNAEPLFEEARRRLADIDVETRAYGGATPAGILTSLAEEESFDAIVIGSPHRGALGRVMLGSVAMSLLNGAPIDVAVAPKDYASSSREAPREIAVGYDGAPESRLALQRAEGLAKSFDAKLRLLTVVRPPVAAPVMAAGAYTPEFPSHPDRVIREGLGSVDRALAAEPIRLDGDPAMELHRACEEDVDLLVLGSRSYGPLTRVLLGSVSRKVAEDAPCPVLVVPRR